MLMAQFHQRGGGFRPWAGVSRVFHSCRANAGQLLFALKGSIYVTAITHVWRKRLKTSNLFHGRKHCAQVIAFFSALVLVCSAALSVRAQSVAFSPYQDESDGVSAGGKWMEFHSEDKMTGAKKARFELLSDNYLREDPEYKPRIQFTCTNGKYTETDFNPGIRLFQDRTARPIRTRNRGILARRPRLGPSDADLRFNREETQQELEPNSRACPVQAFAWAGIWRHRNIIPDAAPQLRPASPAAAFRSGRSTDKV